MSELEKIPPMTFTGHTWADEHRLPPIKAAAGDGRLQVEPKIIRCEQCNGVQSLVYKYRGGPLGSVTPAMPTGSYPARENGANIAYPLYPVCQCPHPETALKHNGQLDERDVRHEYHASVGIIENHWQCDGSKLVVLNGGRGDCENSRILIEPAQALSLLAWLRQEESELLRMAKEQDGD